MIRWFPPVRRVRRPLLSDLAWATLFVGICLSLSYGVLCIILGGGA